ncbi:MAG: flagellin, partial [Acidimicrobiales bacterium]
NEVQRIGSDTTFSGAAVFADGTKNFQVGSEGSGTSGQIALTSRALLNAAGELDVSAAQDGSTVVDLNSFDFTTAPATAAADARTAIEAIDSAISQVSTRRGELGAVQNRFESTINNLQV